MIILGTPSSAAGASVTRPNPEVTKVARAGDGWWDPGRPVRAASYRMIWLVMAPDPASASVTGTAAGVYAVPCGWRLAAATVSRLQRDTCMLAAHNAAIDEPAAIWLVLGHGYAWPAGLKMRRKSTAIARWPDR